MRPHVTDRGIEFGVGCGKSVAAVTLLNRFRLRKAIENLFFLLVLPIARELGVQIRLFPSINLPPAASTTERRVTGPCF